MGGWGEGKRLPGALPAGRAPPPHRPGWAPWPGGGLLREDRGPHGAGQRLGAAEGHDSRATGGTDNPGPLCVGGTRWLLKKKQNMNKEKKRPRSPAQGCFPDSDSNVPVW